MPINSIDWLVFGDSVGLGVAQAASLPCNCQIGRMPDAVLAAIDDTYMTFVAERTVILSTGLSNNPDGRSYVEQQVALLQALDAYRIVILGVGPGNDHVNLAGANEWLAALAERSGSNVIFAGPLTNTRFDTDPKGVHPWSYDQLVDQINAVLDAS